MKKMTDENTLIEKKVKFSFWFWKWIKMRYCIIRGYRSGVHAGWVKERNGTEVTLLETRRLWRWYGKTLSGLAKEGTFNSDGCKFSDEIQENLILDACEVIPCTKKAMESLKSVGPWIND